MDLKKKYHMYIIASFIFSAAITVSIMLPFCQYSTSEKENLTNINALSDSTWYITKNFSKGLALEGTFIPNIMLNSDSGKVALYDVIVKPTLIFRYFDTNCTSCIQTEAKLMQEYASEISDRVMLIGSFTNFHALKAYNTANDIHITGLQIGLDKQLEWEPDIYNSPYYFVLYPGGKASRFFMSVPEFSSYSKTYLEGINRLFSNKE